MKYKKILIILLFVLSISEWSYAASFPCKKAGTESEKAICSDKVLSKLDTFLALAYKKALNRTSHKNALRTSQHKWLNSKRNPCGDDTICLNDAYYLRILKLMDDNTEHTSFSGHYERYSKNKPAFHSSDIDILTLSGHDIYINGTAIWSSNEESAAKGIIHFGQINGIFAMTKNKVRYKDEYGSSFIIIFERKGFTISESHDEGNWGENVTFDGQYRKI